MYDQADIYCEKLGAWQDNDRVVLVKDTTSTCEAKWMPEMMYGCTSGFHFLTSNRIECVCILSLVRTNGFIRHFALLVLRVGKISQLLLLSETGTHIQRECRTEEVLPHLEMAHWWIWWSCYLRFDPHQWFLCGVCTSSLWMHGRSSFISHVKDVLGWAC